ncbi:MAG: carboxylesterase/lipase family protein [Salinibacterium sp.]|nr:carboxylesterase family protein [Salinibacterium sp.]MBF0672413.1 carboxylesterase/lipase family protein [Salinibacterium sp.]
MNAPVVETTGGRVEGVSLGGAHAFLGVPYGASPAGANRFKPSVPVAPWGGVRAAAEPGPLALQSRTGPGTRPDNPAPMDEDCLSLNVWTASLTGAKPVLVWFHGGGFSAGQAITPYSHGAALASRGDVVVVSVTHRLALLGFLNLEELGGDDYAGSGNASLLDLQLALEWVRDNISRFGGDPNAVTIHGHSGGGGKVAALASMPGARGLFRAAVVHGGPPFGFKDHATATRTAEEALSLLGVRADRLDALQDIPVGHLMHVQEQLAGTGGPGPNGMRFAPAVGTPVLPADPYQAFAAGAAKDISFMTGTARDEARAAIHAFPHYLDDPDLSVSQLVDRLRPGLDHQDDAEVLVERYRDVDPQASNTQIFFNVLSDQFTIRTRRLAQMKRLGDGQDSWVYLCSVNQGTPYGAYHGVEMPLFFNNATPTTPGAAAASELSAELVRFASGDMAASDAWHPSGGDISRIYEIDDTGGRTVPDPLANRLSAWDGIIVTPRTDPWTTLWL